MLHCFLDDSGKDSQPSNPYVCMAGYLADLDALSGLHQKWLQLLIKHGISEIHIKDLIPVSGQYRNLGWDIPKRDSVLDDFIQVVRETRLTGVGVALETAAWRKLKKENPDLDFGNVQQFCLQRILRLIIDRLHAAKIDDKIALVFDTDPEFGANRFNIFCALMGHDERATRRLQSITFGHPAYYPGLQCADILAWETRKEMGQRLGGHRSTKRWRSMFDAMPEFHLDYMSELWDQSNFARNMTQVIESFRHEASA